MQLEVKSFALAGALFAGFGTLFATLWIVMFTGQQEGEVWLSMIFRGYELTVKGAAIGLIWGFFVGMLAGSVFAWTYNRLAGSAQPLQPRG